MNLSWKYAAILFPVSILFVVTSVGLVYMGEAMPLWMVVHHQQNDDKVLYRVRYGNRDQQFKRLTVNTRKPAIVALGSSRILQFRAGFFNKQPDAFYNAAAPAWRLEQVTGLIYGLDADALPQVLILAIDPPWFNEAYVGDIFPEEISDLDNIVGVSLQFLYDLIKGNMYTRPNFNTRAYWRRVEPGGSRGTALGMRAIRDGHGFRSDGSEQYGDFLVARWLWQPQQRENHLRLMRRGRDMYVYGDTVSEITLAALDDLLAFASQHEMQVIGYLPPYAPSIWQRMLNRGNHTYVTDLTPQLQMLFDQHQFPFFDFSDGSRVNIQEEEFFDGWHASERANLKLYLAMLEALPDILGEYSDYNGLARIARNAYNTWDVFGMSGVLR